MMESRGAMRSRITAKIAGGAKMFEVSGGALGNIGQRNIESVHINLKREISGFERGCGRNRGAHPAV